MVFFSLFGGGSALSLASPPAARGGCDAGMSGSTQFCKSCFNLMMPREERGERKLVYHCKSCNISQDAVVPVVYRNEVVKSETCGCPPPACAAPPPPPQSLPHPTPRAPYSAATSWQRCPTT